VAPSYRLGKGPIVKALETRLNTQFDDAKAEIDRVLSELSANGLERRTHFEERILKGQNKRHLQQDVFGGPGGNERRAVYYQGLKDAMELARDLGSANRPAPIQLFWGCGQPTNECWVSWSRPAGNPVVTVIFLSDVGAIGTDEEATGRRPSKMDASDDAGMYVVRMDRRQPRAFKAKPTIGA
jgi:hypothetical protein